MSVCLSVCDWTKIQTRKKVTRQKVILKSQSPVTLSICKQNVPTAVIYQLNYLINIFNDIGRWAHFKVKLHFFFEGEVNERLAIDAIQEQLMREAGSGVNTSNIQGAAAPKQAMSTPQVHFITLFVLDSQSKILY